MRLFFLFLVLEIRIGFFPKFYQNIPLKNALSDHLFSATFFRLFFFLYIIRGHIFLYKKEHITLTINGCLDNTTIILDARIKL